MGAMAHQALAERGSFSADDRQAHLRPRAMTDVSAYARQWIDEADMAAVRAVLDSGCLTTGPEGPAFEAAFAKVVGAPHARACASGTAALHLALDGLGVGPGDVCVVPAVTFLASANAARYCGAEVVFADVDPETGVMTAETLAEAIARAPAGRPIAAVIAVHLGGVPCALAALAGICAKAGAALVEDACHGLGSLDDEGAPIGAGAYSAAATFSFHPAKTITTGEGGVVTTRSADLAERIAQRRSHGVERARARFAQAEARDEAWAYEMQALGWNYRLSDIAAALGRAQLKKLPGFAAARRRLSARYDAVLKPYAPILRPAPARAGTDPCRHLYNARIDFSAAGAARPAVMARLRGEGIGTQVHYIPVHRQPYYQRRYGDLSLPGAQSYYAKTLSLPLFPAMTEDDVDRVAQALVKALGL